MNTFKQSAIHAMLVLSSACLFVIARCGASEASGTWAAPVRLGPNVNGPSDNHFPFVTADGKKLYLSAALGALNEDVYVCDWDSLAGEWGLRRRLGTQINTVERELSPCQSPDGQYLWFIRYTPSQSYDLFYSIWDTAAGDWGAPQNAGPQFNSSCVEWAVSISPDGRRMFVDHGLRPDQAGCESFILWISYWNDSTNWWDTLIYMGDFLNRTVRSASMPFDTTLIYFSSGSPYPGVPKFGANADLFVVTNNPPQWDSVDNVGMPVNTYERETDVAITSDGQYLYFSSTRDTTNPKPVIYVSQWTETGVREITHAPQRFALSQPFPNPFNASTSLSITLAAHSSLRVDVHDVLGRYVATLVAAELPAGTHRVRWQADQASSGIYFIRAISNGYASTRKVLYLK